MTKITVLAIVVWLTLGFGQVWADHVTDVLIDDFSTYIRPEHPFGIVEISDSFPPTGVGGVHFATVDAPVPYLVHGEVGSDVTVSGSNGWPHNDGVARASVEAHWNVGCPVPGRRDDDGRLCPFFHNFTVSKRNPDGSSFDFTEFSQLSVSLFHAYPRSGADFEVSAWMKHGSFVFRGPKQPINNDPNITQATTYDLDVSQSAISQEIGIPVDLVPQEFTEAGFTIWMNHRPDWIENDLRQVVHDDFVIESMWQTGYVHDDIDPQLCQLADSGDANCDGVVDAGDLNILAINWNQFVGQYTDGDFTGDSFVGAADLNILALNWQAHNPEPSTGISLTILALIAANRRVFRNGGRFS